MNIFFKKSGVPQFKLVDFSHSFFLDEQPGEISKSVDNHIAPELVSYAKASTP